MDWTKEEVILTVQDYFAMFRKELDSVPYSKAEHRRKLAPLLNNRDKAIEYKHMNISFILASMGLPYIKGYKPYSNRQQLLVDEVLIYLDEHKRFFEKGFQRFAEAEVKPLTKTIDFNSIVDKAPARTKVIDKEPLFVPIKTNFLAREQDNRKTGERGEQIVFDYELWRLRKAGKNNLADNVEWVSKEKGDGLGYDILSKNTNGTDRFIEVKTTKLAKETPIYFSNNEWRFAKLKGKEFYLYRVFNIADAPQFFIKHGDYESFCTVKPQSFKGYF